MKFDALDLTGKLLIAMPGMGDPRFEHSVIYIAAHSQDGAMGLIVNKPTQSMTLADILDVPDSAIARQNASLPLHRGGPVEVERGFVLHSDDYRSDIHTVVFDDGFAMTATQDVLEDIVAGKGPNQALLMLGYAGWGPGQVEGEIAQNGWLSCDADLPLVFNKPDAQKWEGALSSLGVDPLGLSAIAGKA